VSDLGAQRLTPTSFPKLGELNTVVVVPGTPGAARVFTDAEADAGDADAYAAQHGGSLQPLPLNAPPDDATNEID
jgi:hypothetical protein